MATNGGENKCVYSGVLSNHDMNGTYEYIIDAQQRVLLSYRVGGDNCYYTGMTFVQHCSYTI